MPLLRNIFAVTLFLLCIAFTPLHHGWSNYNQNNVLDYKGTIREFKFENPHATAKVKHKAKIWTVILAPTSRMQDRGVPNEKLKKGSTVRIVGYPHKEIKDEMRAERIYIDDQKYELR